MAKKKNPAAAAARTSGATGLRPMSRSRFGGAGPSLRDADEALAQQVARKGLHPIEVARRIISRMPEAWSAVPAQVRDIVPVTTGYNTHWEYRLDKHKDGWTASLTPQDLDARRRTGGKVGGFLGPAGLTARPHAYRTKTEAYEAIAKHAAKGQYLLQRNPSDWAIAYEGRLRDMTSASDGLIRVQMNRSSTEYSMNNGLKKGQALMTRAAAAYRAGKYDSMQEALRGEARKRTIAPPRFYYNPKRNTSSPMENEVNRLGNLLDDYSGGESGDLDYVFSTAPVEDRLDVVVAALQEYRVPAAELKVARKMLGMKKNPPLVVERGFPYHDTSDDLVRRRNTKGGGRSGSKSKALAKGQGLMQQAAAAYRAGRYPTMQAALKGVASLERRQVRSNKGRR